jgi:hypothetical protein
MPFSITLGVRGLLRAGLRAVLKLTFYSWEHKEK